VSVAPPHDTRNLNKTRRCRRRCCPFYCRTIDKVVVVLAAAAAATSILSLCSLLIYCVAPADATTCLACISIQSSIRRPVQFDRNKHLSRQSLVCLSVCLFVVLFAVCPVSRSLQSVAVMSPSGVCAPPRWITRIKSDAEHTRA